jgi:hypothetical protein
MANLIITIIAIALVAAAALMGAYYGGAAWQNSTGQADTTAALNEATQVQMALLMADMRGVTIGSTIPTDYISTTRGSWAVTATNATATFTDVACPDGDDLKAGVSCSSGTFTVIY